MEQHRVTVDRDKCVGCGICAAACAAKNLEMKNQKAETVLEDCILCGHCTAVCPKKAITISGCSTGAVEKVEEVRLNPEAVLDVIRFRRTVRKFKEDKIPRAVLEKILEAGRLTHTAKNMQDVSFVVLEREKRLIECMAVALFQRLKPLADLVSPMARNSQIDEDFFFFKAPAVIAVLARDKTNGILAAQNMEFVAEAYGLGVLFSGFFTIAANTSPKIRRAMKVPKGKSVAMTLVLGYPNVKFIRSAPRKALDVKYM